MTGVPASFLIRRKILSFLDSKFEVFDSSGRLVAFSRQKAFKLREDIRVCADREERQPLLLIRARQILDFSAAYDVVDAVSGAKLGALRRKGWTSFVRDAWEFLDAGDRTIATLQEDSAAMALLRRFINIIPQRFHAEGSGRTLATYVQRFNPFVFRLQVDVTREGQSVLDPRMYLAAGVLLTAVEGRQRN